MANTMTLISSVTVGAGGASTIDFTSIPSTYTDLCLLYSIRSNRSDYGDNMAVRLNGSSSSVYSYIRLVAYGGSTVGSFSGSSVASTVTAVVTGNTATSSTFSNGQIYLPNYLSSSNKSASIDGVTENNAASVLTEMDAYLAAITSAVTQITLLPVSGTAFLQYSTAYLYGVKNA
jgi:hypothetical protein